MNAKIIIGIIILAIIAIIVGLVVLLQKQPKSSEIAVDENGLAIVGESGVASQKEELSVPPPQENSQEIFDSAMPDLEITYSKQPDMTIDEIKDYSAILTTTAGDITIEFTTKETPITVNNFVTLSRDKFYDNTIFHRVIKGFMIQGGDPKGNGTGGPGFKFDDEEFSGSYDRGTVAMANSGPNTNGSQFFIMHESSQSLPPNYVIFGKVTEGLDVVDAIATAQVTTGPSGEPSTPIQPVKITSVKIIEK